MDDDILDFQIESHTDAIIKVIGVGGGGGNAVNHMFQEGIRDVSFALCNTDNQALMESPVPVKLQLGANTTGGLGAGNKPEVAQKAAEESIDMIEDLLNDGTRMVFITAGMGGGTGTGAAPVVARVTADAVYSVYLDRQAAEIQSYRRDQSLKVPADLAGIRMRTPGAPVWMETIRAMGATPTPMGWAEVYPALQQKAIDAVEAQHPASYGSRLYEVTKYITKTGHFNLITGIVTSAKWFDTLPPEYQKILVEECDKAGLEISREMEKEIETLQKDLAAKGMTIVKDVDVAAFKKAGQGAYQVLKLTEVKDQLYKELGKK